MEWKLLGSINAYTQLLYGSPFSEFKCCSIKELNSVRICIERGLERGLSSLLLQKIFLWKNTEFRSKKMPCFSPQWALLYHTLPFPLA